MKKWEVDEHEQWSEKVRSLHCLCSSTSHFIYFLFLSDEGPLETLDYTIRIGSTPTFLYFDLYLYSAYAARYVCLKYYCNCRDDVNFFKWGVRLEARLATAPHARRV